MLLALVPLFDENMAVRAYSIFAQRDNFFLDPMMQGTMQNDGAAAVYGLQMIEEMGIESISDDSEVFVSVSNISIFTDVTEQCSAPHERIVLLIDNTVPPVDVYINRLRELKNLGYKLAIRKLPVADFENYSEVFKLMDYVLLNNRKIAIDKAKIYFGKLYPNIKLVAGNISDMETFEKLKASGGYQLYEGEFYRVPVTKGNTEITPLKVNYIALMNSVNSADFDLEEAADIIGRDPALTISLLQMVNRMTVNSGITTIRHAAAMLGQRELRQWINTAVVKEMYADKPSEITRLSLLRAKFAEYLAVPFNMAVRQEELFLMGLVSVLDVILETSMEEALEKVKVTGEVSKALTKGEGPLANVMELIRQYENANWQEVTRLLLLANVEVSVVNDCYMRSLQWYKKLMLGKEG
ncbi:MAG: HDOD domain-containing protein [Lachnospiraceae bacterium]|nr:HDOD domain-containing protein [Lachnospiraceae bacterium]MCM1238263.1 HDOD domain-containing protein [Lachnospiraceae bacterium]MCM1305256.1 HDOD domain-containing protein [Butyrivibrio sp.]MCM1343659.1 HDOD domain-containing protein [Muribaculaceae bacterium]MCM1410296.1 HDOD domain-containing protein [Lachnospiraceae bacterium]